MLLIKLHLKLEKEWVQKEVTVVVALEVDKRNKVVANNKVVEEVVETVVTLMLLFLAKITSILWFYNQKISG